MRFYHGLAIALLHATFVCGAPAPQGADVPTFAEYGAYGGYADYGDYGASPSKTSTEGPVPTSWSTPVADKTWVTVITITVTAAPLPTSEDPAPTDSTVVIEIPKASGAP